MGTQKMNQIGLEDVVVSDAETEALLEQRENLKGGGRAYRKADKEAKTRIATIDTPPPYRVGRFLIERRITPARSVDVREGSHITIEVA